MTGHQASPAHAGLPAPRAATARPHDPAGQHAACRRPADLRLAAWKKTALYAPVLLGAAAAAVLALAGTAMASPVTGHDATGTVTISAILGNGDIVTGVRGTTGGDVILTGSHAKGDGTNNTLPFLYQGPLTSPTDDSGFHALTPPFAGFDTGTGGRRRSTVLTPAPITRTRSRPARSAPWEATGPATVSSTTA